MLHRALQQFLADVFWGDLDVLLLDLPPGTGDIAISMAQLIPNAEMLVVTTPQQAAAEVAERAGAIALQTRQRLVGVVENMSWLELPDGSRMERLRLRRRADGGRLADPVLGATVPLLGQVPLEPAVREGGDAGMPVVLAAPESRRRRRPCAPWPRSWPCARAGSRACRWACRRSGAERSRASGRARRLGRRVLHRSSGHSRAAARPPSLASGAEAVAGRARARGDRAAALPAGDAPAPALHAARALVRPALHLPVVHPVAAAAQRAGAGARVRAQRRDRLRARGVRGRRVAGRGRPGRPPAASDVVDPARCRGGRRAARRRGARPVLAGPDPRPHGRGTGLRRVAAC